MSHRNKKNNSDKNTQQTLGSFLKSRRTYLGISRKQLSDEVQLSLSQISRLESDKASGASPKALERIATALKVPHDTLLVLAGHKQFVIPDATSQPMFDGEIITPQELTALRKVLGIMRSTYTR